MSGSSQGLGPWMLQRFTAVYLALFMAYVLVGLLFCTPVSHQQWQQWIASPLVNIGFALFFLSLCGHAWVGIRDVIMDYVKPTGIRVSLLALVLLSLMACLLWSWRILFSL